MFNLMEKLRTKGRCRDRSRSHDAVIRVYDATGNVTEMHQHAGGFKEW